jgi:hypothetical protein
MEMKRKNECDEIGEDDDSIGVVLDKVNPEVPMR